MSKTEKQIKRELTAGTYRLDVGPKVYFGSTFNLDQRRRAHSYDLRTRKHPNPKLQKAFDRYQTLRVSLLDKIPRKEGETEIEHRDRLREAEQRHLDLWYGDKRLCNLSPSSRGPGNDFSHIWGDPERKQRMIETLRQRRGAKVSKETREKMAEAKRGANNPRARGCALVHRETGERREFATSQSLGEFAKVSQQAASLWILGKNMFPGENVERGTKRSNQWLAVWRIERVQTTV